MSENRSQPKPNVFAAINWNSNVEWSVKPSLATVIIEHECNRLRVVGDDFYLLNYQ